MSAQEQSAISSGAGLRREPSQARSRERVQRLLDAAAELIEESGVGALAVRDIAERAGVPVGTMYQFFKSKDSVVEALAQTYVDAFAVIAADLAELPAAPTWQEEWRRMFRAFVDYLRDTPGFRAIWFSGALPSELRRLDRANNVTLASALADMFIAHGHATDSERLRLSFETSVQAADTLVGLAFRRDPQGDPRIIEEASVMMISYLDDVLGASPGAVLKEIRRTTKSRG